MNYLEANDAYIVYTTMNGATVKCCETLNDVKDYFNHLITTKSESTNFWKVDFETMTAECISGPGWVASGVVLQTLKVREIQLPL